MAQITQDLRANIGYAYTDAYAVDYPVGQCYSGQTLPATCTGSPAFQNLAGATLPNRTEEQSDHGPGLQTWHSGPAARWRPERQHLLAEHRELFDQQGPGTIQTPYGITNFDLGLTPHRLPNLSVHFFCNNAFDRHYASNLSNVKSNWTFPTASGDGVQPRVAA